MRAPFLAMLTLLIAGCGREAPETADANSAAPAAEAAPAAAAGSITPGRWKVVSTPESGAAQTNYQCVLPEQATSGSFLRGAVTEGCRVERDTVAGGRIDFALACDSESGTMTSRLTGSYTATGYRTETVVEMGSGAPMKASNVGSYAGPTCQPDDFRLTPD